MVSGMSSPAGLAALGGGNVTVSASPDLTCAAGSRIVRAAIITCPSRISAFKRERDSDGICAASTRSRRWPASPGETVTVSTVGMDEAMSDERPLNPEAERAVAKVRRLMMIASVTTFLAVAAVLVVIGYRVFHLGGSVAEPAGFVDTSAALPAGAKVISTAVSNDHIVMTIEVV